MKKVTPQLTLQARVEKLHKELTLMCKLHLAAHLNAVMDPSLYNRTQVKALDSKFSEMTAEYERLYDRLQLVTPCLN